MSSPAHNNADGGREDGKGGRDHASSSTGRPCSPSSPAIHRGGAENHSASTPSSSSKKRSRRQETSDGEDTEDSSRRGKSGRRPPADHEGERRNQKRDRNGKNSPPRSGGGGSAKRSRRSTTPESSRPSESPSPQKHAGYDRHHRSPMKPPAAPYRHDSRRSQNGRRNEPTSSHRDSSPGGRYRGERRRDSRSRSRSPKRRDRDHSRDDGRRRHDSSFGNSSFASAGNSFRGARGGGWGSQGGYFGPRGGGYWRGDRGGGRGGGYRGSYTDGNYRTHQGYGAASGAGWRGGYRGVGRNYHDREQRGGGWNRSARTFDDMDSGRMNDVSLPRQPQHPTESRPRAERNERFDRATIERRTVASSPSKGNSSSKSTKPARSRRPRSKSRSRNGSSSSRSSSRSSSSSSRSSSSASNRRSSASSRSLTKRREESGERSGGKTSGSSGRGHDNRRDHHSSLTPAMVNSSLGGLVGLPPRLPPDTNSTINTNTNTNSTNQYHLYGWNAPTVATAVTTDPYQLQPHPSQSIFEVQSQYGGIPIPPPNFNFPDGSGVSALHPPPLPPGPPPSTSAVFPPPPPPPPPPPGTEPDDDETPPPPAMMSFAPASFTSPGRAEPASTSSAAQQLQQQLPPPMPVPPPAPRDYNKPTVINKRKLPSVDERWGEGCYSEYKILVQVGEGTYGQVYKAQKKDKPDLIVALKKVRLENEKDGFPITAVREIKILRQLDHPNVVKLLNIVTDARLLTNRRDAVGSFYLVFEYVDHDLNGLLDSQMVEFSEPQLASLFKQLVMALEHCHSRHFLHRDLKCANILINNKGELKLADFGLARLYQKEVERLYTNRVITLWYRPPELLLGSEKYGTEVDVWSAGCILGELFAKKPLFQGGQEHAQLCAIAEVCGSPNPETWPELHHLPNYQLMRPKSYLPRRLKEKFMFLPDKPLDLLDRMLQMNPRRRPTAGECLRHPWLHGVDPQRVPPPKLPMDQDCHEMWSKKVRAERKRQQQQQLILEQQGGISTASSSTSSNAAGRPTSSSGHGSVYMR